MYVFIRVFLLTVIIQGIALNPNPSKLKFIITCNLALYWLKTGLLQV